MAENSKSLAQEFTEVGCSYWETPIKPSKSKQKLKLRTPTPNDITIDPEKFVKALSTPEEFENYLTEYPHLYDILRQKFEETNRASHPTGIKCLRLIRHLGSPINFWRMMCLLVIIASVILCVIGSLPDSETIRHHYSGNQ
ncbi:GfV-B60-ORF1 [Ichnoviriform fumiferanae]|uniref:GfV-B60-ORF1 n=1 Tax=Ichnoviriform fumiferanae TaxID=419435 RepID=A2PZV6_9VIRU|nr:GfV-B60-ORF1 [Ichnoviriform fumiferanae]BAF45528.1 GfV-B60-ORF1 [Ichnoviriform fumiferanae]